METFLEGSGCAGIAQITGPSALTEPSEMHPEMAHARWFAFNSPHAVYFIDSYPGSESLYYKVLSNSFHSSECSAFFVPVPSPCQ